MGVNPFEVERESYKRDKSRSIYNEILNRWICIALYNTGIWSSKNLMKARFVYRNVRNATWVVKRHLIVRSGEKWKQRGYYHIEIIFSSHGVGKKNLEGLLWG